MLAMVTTFKDSEADLADGISHVREEVVPAAEATAGVLQGTWLVDRETGERMSVMLFDSDAAAEAFFAAVGERRAADPGRNRPKPTGSRRYEVYARVPGGSSPA
jgi:hypothetical protein